MLILNGQHRKKRENAKNLGNQECLSNFIPQLYDNETVVYFQQDGATAHSARTTMPILREFLNKGFFVKIQRICSA